LIERIVVGSVVMSARRDPSARAPPENWRWRV
jgi:hypothetical protein